MGTMSKCPDQKQTKYEKTKYEKRYILQCMQIGLTKFMSWTEIYHFRNEP